MRFVLFFCFVLSIYTGSAQEIIKYDSVHKVTCNIQPLKNYSSFCQCYNYIGKLEGAGYLYKDEKDGNWKLYDNGILIQEGMYKANQKNGLWKEFFLDGNELFIGNYENDKKNGQWRRYFSDNEDLRSFKTIDRNLLKESFHYKNGKYSGRYKKYFPDGTVEETGKYEDDKKCGVWKYYDLNGKVIKKEKWENGELIISASLKKVKDLI